MADAKPITGTSRLTLTVGGIIAGIAIVFGAGAWAASVQQEVSSIKDSVSRIESQVDKLADFNTRIAVIEAAIVDMRKDQP
jgi:hypothetical protein